VIPQQIINNTPSEIFYLYSSHGGKKMRHGLHLFSISILSLACLSSTFAAVPVDLSHQSPSVLQSFSANEFSLKPISSNVDFNSTTHLRYQQYYQGAPVWGADIVAHAPASEHAALNNLHSLNGRTVTLNGTLYNKLSNDLVSTPASMLTKARADQALEQAVSIYQKKTGIKQTPANAKSELMVYIDKTNVAHWAYMVRFDTRSDKGMPAKPTYILDAAHFDVYLNWDNIQTLEDVQGGGIGGNPKLGKQIYDGVANHLSKLNMQRDAATNTCFLQNSEVRVLDNGRNDAPEQFSCSATDAQHDNIFWNAEQDAVNGGFSPADDALYAGRVIKNMYNEWFKIPVLVQDTQATDKKPLQLTMRVHVKDENKQAMDNAYWDPDTRQMSFGDGQSMFYPLTSLGVAAHEISHGFTSQHSNLAYTGQSGGLNESFSDMAAQAAELYSLNKSSWQIGAELFKSGDRAMRYMDKPSKDCQGTIPLPGIFCSIDFRFQYLENLTEVHFSSGLYNHVFYLIATAPGWDAQKAFSVMVQANANYWTSTSTFDSAACGVIQATKDHKFDVSAVNSAFTTVGINVSKC
jgi:pseudolysin